VFAALLFAALLSAARRYAPHTARNQADT